MKKAGIVCDNYKVAEFKKKLKAKGFGFSVQTGLTKKTKIVQVKFPEERLQELKNLVQDIELGFQGRKN